MKPPLVTAVYNNREAIAQALDSALAQGHPHVELMTVYQRLGGYDTPYRIAAGCW